MATHTVYLDRPVWMREKYSMEIPPETLALPPEELKEWLNDRLYCSHNQMLGSPEELCEASPTAPVFLIDGKEVGGSS